RQCSAIDLNIVQPCIGENNCSNSEPTLALNAEGDGGMGLIELGEVMMTRSERHLELTSQNISNAATPGYKRGVSFDASVDAAHLDNLTRTSNASRPDFEQGALRQTGRPLDLAISGAGFFLLRSSDGHSFYTRNGQFTR